MLEWLILHTVTLTLLTGLVLALGRLFRLAPATRHVLWLIVLIKLLTPPLLFWPWRVPAPFRSQPSLPEPGPTLPVSEPEHSTESVAFPVSVDVAIPVAQPVAAAVPLTEEPAAPPAPEPPRGTFAGEILLPALAGGAWLAGGLVMASVQAVRILRLRRRLAGARAVPDELVRHVTELATRLGLRPPALRVLPDLGSPMLCGWGEPRLLWPEGLEATLPPEGQQAVLVHELAHLRRRDHWTAWVLLLGGCVWWWHPLFWLVRRQLAREAELACDAWVVETLPEARRAYAEALLEVALRGSWTAAAAPALGAAGSRRDFERRLILIMREHLPCRLSPKMVLVAGALVLLTLPAWTLGYFDPPTTTPAAGPVYLPAGALPAPAVEVAPAFDRVPFVAPLFRNTTSAPAPEPKPDDAAREKKLRDLEERIRVLLKELHELRGDGRPPATAIIQAVPAPPLAYYEPITRLQDGRPVTSYRLVPATGGEQEMTLTRVVYKLPAAKAEALAAFLKENVKAQVLETKVEDEHITITTTPETQRTIGQFISLLRGKSENKPDQRTNPPAKRQ
jgi:beta-lactamase regulating signal transducer with metallopeptidase domain